MQKIETQNHNELKSAAQTQDHPAVCVFEGFKYCIEVRNDTKKRNVLRQIEWISKSCVNLCLLSKYVHTLTLSVHSVSLF